MIPAEAQLQDTINRLKEELAGASNIKSKQTRSAVEEALGKLIRFLQQHKKTPENGLAIYAGEGEVYALEPPQKLNVKKYLCDKKFFTAPLEEMLQAKNKYGLIALDGNEATIAVLNGVEINVVKQFISEVPNKTTKGGQSKARYQRDRQERLKHFYHKIEKYGREAFGGVKAIIVGGPGPIKEEMVKFADFYPCRELIVVDSGYADDCAFPEMMEKAKGKLEQQELIEETEILQEFKFGLLNGTVSYGLKEVKEDLESGRAKILLLSEESEFADLRGSCPVRFVSAKTALGAEFLRGFGGVAIFRKW